MAADEYSKTLTNTDLNRLVVRQEWLKILPPLEEWIDVDGDGDGGKEVTIKALCMFGYTWEFRCYVRGGIYSKPNLQALEWTRFVNYAGLRKGDKVVLRKQHNPQRGTDYCIIAQREDADGRWADLERPKRADPLLYHHLF